MRQVLENLTPYLEIRTKINSNFEEIYNKIGDSGVYIIDFNIDTETPTVDQFNNLVNAIKNNNIIYYKNYTNDSDNSTYNISVYDHIYLMLSNLSDELYLYSVDIEQSKITVNAVRFTHNAFSDIIKTVYKNQAVSTSDIISELENDSETCVLSSTLGPVIMGLIDGKQNINDNNLLT